MKIEKQSRRNDGELRSIELLKVLKLTLLRGEGTDEQPYRLIDQYFILHEDDKTEYLGEDDTWNPYAEVGPDGN